MARQLWLITALCQFVNRILVLQAMTEAEKIVFKFPIPKDFSLNILAVKMAACNLS